jgi:ribosome maturation factor RimP
MKAIQAITRAETTAKVERAAEAAALHSGLELVEVELKGVGKSQLLRITIDKPGGVTHADCEAVSRDVSAALDADDPIPGSYQLEVTSPGLERKLKKWQDWERFRGQKAKVVLKEPAGDLKHFDGVIASVGEDQTITVELAGGRQVTFPFAQVDRANLKFEW